MARHRIEIDKKSFENLCGLQCTLEEIAGFFECSSDTIERWCLRTYHENFADVFKKKRGVGKIALRRYQFQLAKKNATMAIWLGKQYLGQRDHQTVEVKTDNDEKYTEEIQRRIAEMRCVANADVLSCDSRSENRTDETDGNS